MSKRGDNQKKHRKEERKESMKEGANVQERVTEIAAPASPGWMEKIKQWWQDDTSTE